jgi:hypothetical protein
MYANTLLPLVVSLYYILVPRRLRTSWMVRRTLKREILDNAEHQPA